MLGLAGCGRIGFDAAALDASPGVDAPDPLGMWRPPTMVPLGGSGGMTGDDDPTLTHDLLELYLSRNDGLFVSKRASTTAAWSDPIIEPNLSTQDIETQPELTGDGLQVYFTTVRPRGVGNHDVWSAARASRTDGWGPAASVNELNSSLTDYGGATTADGLLIVIVSNAAGTFDLYSSERASTTAGWSPRSPIENLSTSVLEDEPFISADGLALYYTSTNFDLYVSHRANRIDPFPVGVPIEAVNSASQDRDAWVSPDGRYMMFASNRSGSFRLWETSR